LGDAAGLAKYAHSLGAFGKILDFVASDHHLAVCFEEMQSGVQSGRGAVCSKMLSQGPGRVK
jgi:hypothetical protein